MKKPVSPPKTVLETILEWSQGRPLWQRDALRRIVAKGHVEATDVKELVDLCKQSRGARGITLRPEALAKGHLPANPGQGAAVSLDSITDAAAVNNLAPDQTLAFGPEGITIVYGDNGAGKSGYARILKRACRARHAGKIEPNIYAQQPPPPRASATITYRIAGLPQPPEKWQDADRPHPTLSAVSVFDSDCAGVHIRERNEVAFRPFGLDIPDELARACQAVKDALAVEQKQFEKARNPIFSKPPWKDGTTVGKALAALSHATNVQMLETFATLSEDESSRLARLKEDLSKDPAKAAAEEMLRANNIRRLREAVAAIEAKTDDKALTILTDAVEDARVKRETARLAAAKAFSGEPLEGVGDEVWRALWESARRYSVQDAYPNQPFPVVAADARCVLCQQPLDDNARDRMARFDEFIREDTEQQAQLAERAATKARRDLATVVIATRDLTYFRELALQDSALAGQTRRFLAAARLRRYALVRALNAAQQVVLPAVPPNPSASLATLETAARDHAAELQTAATASQRKQLEAELAELTDRLLLGGMMSTVRDEVERLKTLRFLEQCIADTSTNAITKLGNDLADTVITPKLRDRFQEEIVKLAADKVRVEIVRSGGKYGSPEYQVRLFAKPDARVQDILSEGEKTCVALAAFLTELATAAHLSSLVFDDPITSLDHRWRSQVAQRLVDEAEHRQIIVFTHDLIFVNDLVDMAGPKKRPIHLVTVSRGAAGTGVTTEGLPWKGKSVEDRIDKLEKALTAAKKLYDANKEEDYERETHDIYNHLRAAWERTLEDIVFARVVQRHRDYIDTKPLKKVTVLTEADCGIFQGGFKRCCDIVDSHDPSSGRNAVAPLPDEIAKDIKALKDWVADLRARQRKIT